MQPLEATVHIVSGPIEVDLGNVVQQAPVMESPPVVPLEVPEPNLLQIPPLPSAPPPPIPASSVVGAPPSLAATDNSNMYLYLQLRSMDFTALQEHFRLDIATKLHDPLWGIPKDKVRDVLKLNSGTISMRCCKYMTCA